MDADKDTLERKLSMKTDAPGSHSSDENQEEINTLIEENSGDNNDSVEMPDHLRQFDVLDEVQGDDSGSEIGDNDQRGKYYCFPLNFTWNSVVELNSINIWNTLEIDSSDSDVEEIDIDNLLDEGLPDDLRERKKMHNYEEKTKLVLEGKHTSTKENAFHTHPILLFNHQKKGKITLRFYQRDGFR